MTVDEAIQVMQSKISAACAAAEMKVVRDVGRGGAHQRACARGRHAKDQGCNFPACDRFSQSRWIGYSSLCL